MLGVNVVFIGNPPSALSGAVVTRSEEWDRPIWLAIIAW